MLAVTEGYLKQNVHVDLLSRIKQYFAKSLSKQLSNWFLSGLQNMENNIADPSTGYTPTFSNLQHKI